MICYWFYSLIYVRTMKNILSVAQNQLSVGQRCALSTVTVLVFHLQVALAALSYPVLNIRLRQ